jgi:hypothetical protein
LDVAAGAKSRWLFLGFVNFLSYDFSVRFAQKGRRWREMAAVMGPMLRLARLLIDSNHKEVQRQASYEDESGENRGRENCSFLTCKESFHCDAQKPDLDNQENDNECHCTIDGHKSASLLGKFEIGHISFPVRLQQGVWRHPFRE